MFPGKGKLLPQLSLFSLECFDSSELSHTRSIRTDQAGFHGNPELRQKESGDESPHSKQAVAVNLFTLNACVSMSRNLDFGLVCVFRWLATNPPSNLLSLEL